MRLITTLPAAGLLTIAAVAAPAQAAPATQATSAVVASTGAVPVPAAASYHRPVVVKKWIRKYHLTHRELRGIAQAKRWAATPKSRSVIRCESGFDYRMVDGPYRGAWQFLTSTWLSSGGGRYAPDAHLAPRFAQDHIAWKLWKRSGWGPWSCA